jgi:hypothetical protein
MNPLNYATLEQSKRLKELGYPQDNTDCVWLKINDKDWELLPRGGELSGIEMNDILANCPDDEWYAAPNAQEIELSNFNGGFAAKDNSDTFYLSSQHYENYSFGQIHHAQARADAKIWELANKGN